MKTCNFIRNKKKVYVPLPTNWLAGWARQRWLEKYFTNDIIMNVGAERWAELLKNSRLRQLIEVNGKFKEKKID